MIPLDDLGSIGQQRLRGDNELPVGYNECNVLEVAKRSGVHRAGIEIKLGSCLCTDTV